MSTVERLRHISEKDLCGLGLQQIAYIRPVMVNDESAFAIHAADGTPVALMHDLEIAISTIRQNDLEPVSVH